MQGLGIKNTTCGWAAWGVGWGLALVAGATAAAPPATRAAAGTAAGRTRTRVLPGRPGGGRPADGAHGRQAPEGAAPGP
jgi:hypothetical protein